MPLEPMHQVLLEHLRECEATTDQIKSWESKWYAAVASAGDPFFCPRCFASGKEDSVIKQIGNLTNHISRGRCLRCEFVFEYPDA